MKRQTLSLLLAIIMVLTVLPNPAATVFADTNTPQDGQTTVSLTPGAINAEQAEQNVQNATPAPVIPAAEPILAYVPLDNRPVNVDRVIYEAESAGFEVLMPSEDLYATRLDGQPKNSNGKPYGDTDKLLEWIEKADEKTDYFVISLDQLLSGGLVNSRSLHNTDYEKEEKIIDEIIDLAKDNHVYIVDTVARLACCTVGYEEATLETYNYLRQYNQQPRKVLTGSALTVESIVEGYDKDDKGKKVPVVRKYNDKIKTSFQTRERKLHIIDYMLSQDTDGRIKYFIGVDDSTPQITIQTNEINYIRQKMGDRGLIYSGADELGMMAVLCLMIDHYGYDVKAATVYFGETQATSSGSEYDAEVIQENVEKHLKSIGVSLVAPEEADLEIVVLTPPAQPILNSKYISKMIDYLNKNIAQGIPTIVINTAPGTYSGNLEYRMIRECEMSMFLSFSSWGTVGNSIGLALCNGISRYLYLHSQDSSSDQADIAFLKGLTFSYEKDISYLRAGGKTYFNDYLTNNGWSTSNFYKDARQAQRVHHELEQILKTKDYNVTVNDIINNLTDSRYFKGLSGECGIIKSIDTSNYSAPFYRSNEIRFDINVELNDATLNGFQDAMTISLPYTPAEGQLTYLVNLYYIDETGKMHKVPSTYNEATGQIQFATNKLPYFFTDTMSMEEVKAYSLFKDVQKSSWYFSDVIYVYNKGLMKGMTETTFEPDRTMTRAMLVQTLYQMSGDPEAAFSGELPQDLEDSWYLPAVKWALINHVASGYGDGTFGPNDPVTREQLANILWNYATYKGIKPPKEQYPDAASYADADTIDRKSVV